MTTSIALSDWLTRIQDFHTSSVDLGLERIQPLAKALSLEHFSCPVIMVGGTNGKGSTVRLLEAFYLAAGYRVAAYTSPHLIQFNERLRINGESVSDESLVDAFECIDRARAGKSLSFFEFTTLACLELAKREPLDVLLLEVGLGGRLDAVNVVEPDVSVITSIGLDHIEWLGGTREAIAKEKAGIFRAKHPVVCGDEDPPSILMNIAEELSAPFYCLGRDFHVKLMGDRWIWESPEKRYLNLSMPSLKLENAATAMMAADLLQARLPLTQFAFLKGLKARLAGRFEVLENPARIVFDVAHNADSAVYLAKQLKAHPIAGRNIIVFSALKDKAIADTAQALVSAADAWYIGGLAVARGASSLEIMDEVATCDLKNCYNFDSVAQAFNAALQQASSQDRIVVFGSFHTVAEAKLELRNYSRKL